MHHLIIRCCLPATIVLCVSRAVHKPSKSPFASVSIFRLPRHFFSTVAALGCPLGGLPANLLQLTEQLIMYERATRRLVHLVQHIAELLTAIAALSEVGAIGLP